MEAICYLTANKNIKEMELRYHQLPSTDYFKRFVLSETNEPLSYNAKINHHRFSFRQYIPNKTILRYTYISVLDFYRKNPYYDYYWLLEDDLIFKGNFEIFFNFYKNNTHDFLLPYYHFDFATATRSWFVAGSWYHSPYNRIYGPYFTDTPIAGGFVGIARFSNRLLRKISDLLEQGIYGHCESFPHTICIHNGFDIHSINLDPFHDFAYCDQDKRFTKSQILNIPENNLIHAVKF